MQFYAGFIGAPCMTFFATLYKLLTSKTPLIFLSHFRKIFTSTLGGVFPLSPRHDPVSKVLKEAFKKRSLTFVIFFVGDETPV